MRISLKVVGAAGQGINSIGEIVAKGLKRAGYCVFGYREYPSLIKGGHTSYQLDVSDERIESSETQVDVLLTYNHHGLELNLHDLKDGGVIVHFVEDWKFSADDQALLAKKKLRVIKMPVEKILKEMGAKSILGNVLLTGFLWSVLGQEKEALKSLVGERFAKKKDLLEANLQCVEKGYAYEDPALGKVTVELPKPVKTWKDSMLLTGSEAMGLGAIHAGVRFYAGYPMTPSSPLLSFIADLQNKTGMVVKQAEDEITAAQMVSGAMHMGTRALTGTSGGGFDLMTETLSLNAIIENPTVFVLAQRPGPATGLPTWTAQGDLLLAVHGAHGEFARCVIGVSNAEDAFRLMPVAFNLAEEYQISVIVLTDKQIAEALYTEPQFDQSKTELKRGLLVTDPKKIQKLKASDRFDPAAKDGISPRWLPGTEAPATWNAQGDEHGGDGSVNEHADNAKAQMEKRMSKQVALKKALPEPELWTVTGSELRVTGKNPELDVLLIGWGSTKGPVLDALRECSRNPKPVTRNGYLHFSYLWPLKTERLLALARTAKKVVLVEGNFTGQLGTLIAQEGGLRIEEKILKYDGRPFFVDELVSHFRDL